MALGMLCGDMRSSLSKQQFDLASRLCRPATRWQRLLWTYRGSSPGTLQQCCHFGTLCSLYGGLRRVVFRVGCGTHFCVDPDLCGQPGGDVQLLHDAHAQAPSCAIAITGINFGEEPCPVSNEWTMQLYWTFVVDEVRSNPSNSHMASGRRRVAACLFSQGGSPRVN